MKWRPPTRTVGKPYRSNSFRLQACREARRKVGAAQWDRKSLISTVRARNSESPPRMIEAYSLCYSSSANQHGCCIFHDFYLRYLSFFTNVLGCHEVSKCSCLLSILNSLTLDYFFVAFFWTGRRDENKKDGNQSTTSGRRCVIFCAMNRWTADVVLIGAGGERVSDAPAHLRTHPLLFAVSSKTRATRIDDQIKHTHAQKKTHCHSSTRWNPNTNQNRFGEMSGVPEENYFTHSPDLLQ